MKKYSALLLLCMYMGSCLLGTTNNEQEIIAALNLNDISAIQKLIDSGISVDSTAGGIPLLTLAVMNGSEEIVKFLLERRANPNNELNRKERSALHWAANDGNVKITKALLKYHADPDKRDSRGNTALYLAVHAYEQYSLSAKESDAKNKYTEVIKVLINYGAHLSTIDPDKVPFDSIHYFHTDSDKDTAKELGEYYLRRQKFLRTPRGQFISLIEYLAHDRAELCSSVTTSL